MLTRRKMLVVTSAGVTAVAIGVAGHGCDYGSKPVLPDRFRAASFPVPPSGDLIAAKPGPLPGEDGEILRRIADRLAKRWELPTLKQETFAEFLSVKSEEAPSYRGEYHNAADLYRSASSLEGEAAALDQLLDEKLGAATREGHAHRYVIVELLRLIVVHGGFRVFGYQNYPGHAAGDPFAYRQ